MLQQHEKRRKLSLRRKWLRGLDLNQQPSGYEFYKPRLLNIYPNNKTALYSVFPLELSILRNSGKVSAEAGKHQINTTNTKPAPAR